MKLKLIRDTFTEKSTIGKLFVNDIYESNTLEDVVRYTPKVYGKTAIPEGNYQVIVDYSNKYQRDMPHVLNVPGFEGIRIHAGNKAEDTEGCILLGLSRKPDWIGQSRTAFESFFDKLDEAISRKEKVTLEIVNARGEV
jgi:hypothetical protein